MPLSVLLFVILLTFPHFAFKELSELIWNLIAQLTREFLPRLDRFLWGFVQLLPIAGMWWFDQFASIIYILLIKFSLNLVYASCHSTGLGKPSSCVSPATDFFSSFRSVSDKPLASNKNVSFSLNVCKLCCMWCNLLSNIKLGPIYRYPDIFPYVLIYRIFQTGINDMMFIYWLMFRKDVQSLYLNI